MMILARLPRPRSPPRADVVDGVHGSALVSYNAGISACEKGKQWQWALALISEMQEVKVVPDVISTTLQAYARARGAGMTWRASGAPGGP